MNPMMLMQMVFGNQAQQIMNRWNSMSPEQKQQELSKVSGMTKEQQMNYLKGMGVDMNLFNGMGQNQGNSTPQQVQNQGRKFNY